MTEGGQSHGKAARFWKRKRRGGKKCTHCKHKRGHDHVAQVNSLEAGLDVKYLSILLCIEGIRQQQRTAAFSAIIPRKKLINKGANYEEMQRDK